MFSDFFSLFQRNLFSQVFHLAFNLAPLWVPFLSFILFAELWMTYKRREYLNKQGGVLLEIRLPKQMTKSPQAMELFFNAISNPYPGTIVNVYLKGQTRTWYSLELVSTEGAVHFYIWSQKMNKNKIETQLYAQFPNIEVHEVPDYALKIDFDLDKYKFGWFGQFKLEKKDPYPIKTYVDYGLDKDPDEEFKIDPLLSVIEFLGSLKKGEHCWIQILIQNHVKEGLKHGRLIVKENWKKAAENEVKEIIKKAVGKEQDPKTPTFLNLTENTRNTINAIERSISKTAYDTMIRATYFAEKESYTPDNIGGLIGAIYQFNSKTLNGFKSKFTSGFDYPWQDFKDRRKKERIKNLLEAYKRRSFFNGKYKNFHGRPFVMTAEELATIFHFPGEVAATPTLERLPSKKAEAPSNLPV